MLQREQVQKSFKVVMGLMFIVSLVSGILPLYTTAGRVSAPAPLEAPDQTLQEQARGFARVLQREPNNVVALEGLAATRQQLQDPQGAIAPLETLVAQYPDRADYQQQLAQVRQQAAQAGHSQP